MSNMLPKNENEPLVYETVDVISIKQAIHIAKLKGKSKEYIAHKANRCTNLNCRICNVKKTKTSKRDWTYFTLKFKTEYIFEVY